MTEIERTAQSLSLEAQRCLMAYVDRMGAAPPVGFPATVFAELAEARLVTPRLHVLTHRGKFVREWLLDQRLNAMDPPASGPDPRDELVAAAREWLAAANPMTLIFDGPALRLARAIAALER